MFQHIIISNSGSTCRHSSSSTAVNGDGGGQHWTADGVIKLKAGNDTTGSWEAANSGCSRGPIGGGDVATSGSRAKGVGWQGSYGGGAAAAAHSPLSDIKKKSFAELQQLVHRYRSSIKLGDLLAMFSRLKLVPGASSEQKVSLLQQLLQIIGPRLHQCQPRGLAEVMLTCSKLGYGGDQLYSRCLDLFVSKLRQADARRLANVVYAVATAQHNSSRQQCWPVVEDQLLPAFIEAVTQGEGQPQNIANVVWGVATMGQQLPEQQVQLLVGGFVSKLEVANPQGIANLLWAVASMGGVVPQEKLQHLLDDFTWKLATATPQAVGNVVWGVAKMQQQVPAKQLQQLLIELSAKVATATPQGISNAVWGVATLGQNMPAKQLKQLVGAMLGKAQEIVPQNISNMIWGIATMGQEVSFKQLDQLLTILASMLPSTKPQEVANTLWGVASLQPQPFFPAALLELEARQVILGMLPCMTPQGLATIALACGWLGYKDDKLLLALFDNMRQALPGVCTTSNSKPSPKIQHLANMGWAAAVLDLQQLISHVEHFAAAASSKWEVAAAENKLQLYQVHMWLLDQQQGNSRGLSACLTEQQLSECRDQWQKQLIAGASARASSTQRAVSAAAQHLEGLSCPPQQEAVTADGVHSIDVLVVTAGGVQVAIEFDGPSHFRQPDLQPTGSTQWRNRSLAARGYVVVSVPYWEWDKLPTSQHVAYLESKVQQGVLEANQLAVPAVAAAAPPLPQPPSSSASSSTRAHASPSSSSSVSNGAAENSSSSRRSKKRPKQSPDDSAGPMQPADTPAAGSAAKKRRSSHAAPFSPLLQDIPALFARLDQMSMSDLRQVAAAVSASGLVKVVTSGPGRTKAVVMEEIKEVLEKGVLQGKDGGGVE